jgi:hypothetical protein
MTDLVPGWPVHVEDSTANHWVGSCGDLVMVFVYEGSADDVRHISTGAELVERLHRERRAPVRLLFALPPHHAKPPSSRVRRAFTQAAKRLEGRVLRAAVVVASRGFGAAIQRGAITGIIAIVRPKVSIKVEAGLREGLRFLLGDNEPVFEPLLKLCEQTLAGSRSSREQK